jgi:c-di-GMP-binding flagellar brake protein YcgR
MGAEERRKFRRLPLQLPIAKLSEGTSAIDTSGVRTYDVSAGGMYFSVPSGVSIASGSKVDFEIDLPAGEGYSTTPCRVKGSGTIIRRMDLSEGMSGLAVRFNQPLAFEL